MGGRSFHLIMINGQCRVKGGDIRSFTCEYSFGNILGLGSVILERRNMCRNEGDK